MASCNTPAPTPNIRRLGHLQILKQLCQLAQLRGKRAGQASVSGVTAHPIAHHPLRVSPLASNTAVDGVVGGPRRPTGSLTHCAV